MILSNHPIGVGRLELPRALCPTDFKSGVSTDSTILPYVSRHIIHRMMYLVKCVEMYVLHTHLDEILINQSRKM